MPTVRNVLLTAASSFTGTLVGNGARVLLQARHRRRLDTQPDDEQVVVNAVISLAVISTAAAIALPGRGPLGGFLIGAGLSAAAGDALDRAVLGVLNPPSRRSQ